MPDHFYTTDPEDFQLMKTRYGYQEDEIPVGGVETTQVDLSVPLFRLWTQATDNHFYTIDPAERDQFQADWYQYEGIAGYVYDDDVDNPDRPQGLYPVYRLYRESINDYLYTMSDERAAAMQEHGYVPRGTAWYMYREDPVGRLEGTPLLGAYRPSQLTLQADTGDQPVGEGAWMHTTVTLGPTEVYPRIKTAYSKVHIYSHKKFQGFEGGMYFDLLDRNGAEVARSNIYENLKVCGQLEPCPDSARFEFKDGFSRDAFDAAFSIRINQYQVSSS